MSVYNANSVYPVFNANSNDPEQTPHYDKKADFSPTFNGKSRKSTIAFRLELFLTNPNRNKTKIAAASIWENFRGNVVFSALMHTGLQTTLN